MKNNKDYEIAVKVAEMYMEKFPRKSLYGTTLGSDMCEGNEMTFYHEHTPEELEVLRKCSAKAAEEGCTLEEIMENEGLWDLMCKIGENNTPWITDYIDSIDLDNPKKFTSFIMMLIDEEGQVFDKSDVSVSLTDEEYKEIFVAHMLRFNHYTMNMMVYDKPELCQKIMKELTWKGTDYVDEIPCPFAVEMPDFKHACNSILNPSEDVLNLFNSEDEELKTFAIQHQQAPKDGELYECREIKDGETVFFLRCDEL